jgi:hypothetical protein
MAIIKWDPLGNISTLQDRINKLFDDSFPCQTDGDGETPFAPGRPVWISLKPTRVSSLPPIYPG